MKQKQILKLVLWIATILLLLQLATALGVRPAATTIISDQTRDIMGRMWIVNNDQHSLEVKIYVEGEMGKYITLNQTKLSFREDDDALPLDFEVHLPESVPPGISAANIVIEQVLESTGLGEISSKLILKHKVTVEGPYPDKFVKTKLNFNDAGDKIHLISEVENLGKKPLEKVYTTFYVNNKKQEQEIIKSEESSLQQKENKLLTAEVSKENLDRGEFDVSAVTVYDDQKVEISSKLRVGQPEVDIIYFDPYFIANKINKYSLDLLNKWNKRIDNIYVDVEVKKDQQKIDSFRTKSIDLEGAMVQRINDYFDARGKNPGKYVFDMEVNFWNTYKMDKKSFQSELIFEEEYKSLPLPNLAGGAVESKNNNDFNYTLIWWIGGALILGALGSFALWRYIHRKEYEY